MIPSMQEQTLGYSRSSAPSMAQRMRLIKRMWRSWESNLDFQFCYPRMK